MLARLIATVAALLLACASPQADAYVRAERASMSLADLATAERSESAHQAKSAPNPKTALPARARPENPTPSKNAALSHCRVWKNWSPLQKCASVPAVYQWDGTRLAGTTNALGNPIADYQHAYSWPLTSRENGERSYLHPDTHGTPQLITTATGAIAGWTRTDIWGVPQADSGQQSAIGYTGYLKDPLLDELYAQARQYRPGSGRFTSVDPWEGDPNNPLSLNKYLYGLGNPGVYTDPDGRCSIPSLCAYGFARNEDERLGALRSFANSDPMMGRAVGIGVRLAAPVIAANTARSAIEGDPAARARVAEFAGAAGEFIKQRLTTLATKGAAELVRQDVVTLGTGIGESAAETQLAGERGDYVGQGMAGFDTASQVAAAAPVAGAPVLLRVGRGNVARAQLAEAPDGSLGVRFNVVDSEAGQIEHPHAPPVIASAPLSMETGPYRLMKRRTDIEGQAHHLNQDAMYGKFIPHGDAVTVTLRGDAFREPGTPHYQAHQAQEAYLSQFRQGGERFRERPSNLDMSRATLDALQKAGYTNQQAKQLVREAMRDRLKYGLLGGQKVPRVPRRINQVQPPDEP